MTVSDMMKAHTIVDITDYVHVIDGKVVCYEPDTIDFESLEQVENLFFVVSQMFVGDVFPEDCGRGNTCYVFNGTKNEKCKWVHSQGMHHFPPELMAKVRVAVNEYNVLQNKMNYYGLRFQNLTVSDMMKLHTIVDVDDNVHVIDGKCLLYKPDAIDFEDEEQVSDLFWLVAHLWVDKDFPAHYGKYNTYMMILGHKSDKKKVLSTGYLDCFPEVIRKRVEYAIREFQS